MGYIVERRALGDDVYLETENLTEAEALYEQWSAEFTSGVDHSVALFAECEDGRVGLGKRKKRPARQFEQGACLRLEVLEPYKITLLSNLKLIITKIQLKVNI